VSFKIFITTSVTRSCFTTQDVQDQDRFLGRLPKVDLIILEGGKTSVLPSVRPQKVYSISMKFGIQVEVDE